MRMIMIVVINYNKDRGFGFWTYDTSPSIPFQFIRVYPPAMTYAIA